jgi:hypothetical protein
MAIVTNTATIGADRGDAVHWHASVFTKDIDASSTALAIKAAPSTGQYHYLKHLIIFCTDTAASWTLKDGTTIAIGPVAVEDTNHTGYIDLRFDEPIKFTGAINLLAGADDNSFQAFATGYTA